MIGKIKVDPMSIMLSTEVQIEPGMKAVNLRMLSVTEGFLPR